MSRIEATRLPFYYGCLCLSLSYEKRDQSGPVPALSFEQLGDAILDLVSNGSYPLEWLTLRVFERPVLAAKTGNKRALIAAAHGDEKVSSLSKLGSQALRPCRGQVDAKLSHHLHDLGMDVVSRSCAGRDRMGALCVRQLGEKCRRYL